MCETWLLEAHLPSLSNLRIFSHEHFDKLMDLVTWYAQDLEESLEKVGLLFLILLQNKTKSKWTYK